MFRFGAPVWLPALALVPALVAVYWLSAKRRQRLLERFGESDLVKRLTGSVNSLARRTKAAFRVAAASLVVLALARPQFGTRVETVRSVGQDVLVAVDLSESMLAEDVSPNRLERTRLSIMRLIGRLDGDRIGLVAFAGDAFVQSPLTVDYTAATMFLGAMEPGLMPVQGTDLGRALEMSLDVLENGAREERVLVVVTDGEDHEGALDTHLERAVRGGVTVHTVGIGSAAGVPIPEVDAEGRRRGFKRDADGSVITTRLDEVTLRRVADATGGRYVHVDGTTGFEDLIDEIAGRTGEALEARQITQFEEQYQVFLGLALALLLAEALLPERRGWIQALGRRPA